MNYRPEIDGLRACAIIPVILFHAGFDFCKGGFLGVDVFFVISGYLITGILIKEREKGIFSLTKFVYKIFNCIVQPFEHFFCHSVMQGQQNSIFHN